MFFPMAEDDYKLLTTKECEEGLKLVDEKHLQNIPCNAT